MVCPSGEMLQNRIHSGSVCAVATSDVAKSIADKRVFFMWDYDFVGVFFLMEGILSRHCRDTQNPGETLLIVIFQLSAFNCLLL